MAMNSVRLSLSLDSMPHQSPSDPSDYRRHLQVSAEGIRELHLPRSPALSLEHRGRADKDAKALRSRCGDVESVGAVKELHPAWRVSMARGRHRIDHDRRLLPLKLVDRPNARAGQPLLQLEDLRVVRGDNQNIFKPDGCPYRKSYPDSFRPRGQVSCRPDGPGSELLHSFVGMVA
jgi:hypothetical protein